MPSSSDVRGCPRCRAPMAGESLEGAVIFTCATCLGCFVPERAWSAIMDRVTANAPMPMPRFVPLPPGRELAPSTLCETVECPICARAMDRITFGGARSEVVVDVCTNHGTWFDAAELVRVKQFVHAREENGGVVPLSAEARREELDHALRIEQRRLADRAAAARAAQRRSSSGFRQGDLIGFLAALLRGR